LNQPVFRKRLSTIRRPLSPPTYFEVVAARTKGIGGAVSGNLEKECVGYTES
jgi:hypothetical protein